MKELLLLLIVIFRTHISCYYLGSHCFVQIITFLPQGLQTFIWILLPCPFLNDAVSRLLEMIYPFAMTCDTQTYTSGWISLPHYSSGTSNSSWPKLSSLSSPELAHLFFPL